MLQKKPNIEYEKAMIESQPKAVVYKPHPTKKGIVQRFKPSYKLDETGHRSIELGKAECNFRECVEGDTPDTMIFSIDQQKLVGYKRC